MAFKVLSSVGKNGKNFPQDVKLVQSLINVYARKGDKAVLVINGKNNADLESAISAFQKEHMKLSISDSRVDPAGKTIRQVEKYSPATR